MSTSLSIDLITLELQKFLGNIPFSLKIKTTQVNTAMLSGSNPHYRKLESAIAQDLKELVYKDFSSHSKIPYVSVSHSCFNGELTVAVIGSTHPIGIDLEHSHRKVHPHVFPRICTPDEIKLGLTVLQAWTVKEAAFKAFQENNNTVLSSYQIASWNADQQGGVIQFPNCDFGRFCINQLGPWHIAVAVSEPKLSP